MTTTLAPTSAILEPQSPEMTKAEIAAIRTLRRLAKRWPNTLWLASMSGTLSVMRTSVNGERMYHPHKPDGSGGGLNASYRVATIAIPNDGGDW